MTEHDSEDVFIVVESRADYFVPVSHGAYADEADAEAIRERELDEDVHGQEVKVVRETIETDVHIPDTNPCGCEAEFPEFPDHGIRECQNCGYREELE